MEVANLTLCCVFFSLVQMSAGAGIEVNEDVGQELRVYGNLLLFLHCVHVLAQVVGTDWVVCTTFFSKEYSNSINYLFQ